MEPLPHGLLVLSSSKPLTGRTGHNRLRDASVYWNYTGDIMTAWYTGILHRTRTRRKMKCLVGTPPLRLPLLLLLPERRDHLAQRHLAGDRLRIAIAFASHRSSSTNHLPDDQQPPTLTTDYFLARPTNGNSLLLHQYIPFGNHQHPGIHSTWSFHCLQFMYTPVLSVVQYRCEAAWQPSMPVTWKYSTSNSVCVFIVFAIYPKLLNIFYFTLLPLFHRNNTHHPPPLL